MIRIIISMRPKGNWKGKWDIISRSMWDMMARLVGSDKMLAMRTLLERQNDGQVYVTYKDYEEFMARRTYDQWLRDLKSEGFLLEVGESKCLYLINPDMAVSGTRDEIVRKRKRWSMEKWIRESKGGNSL